MWQFEHKALTQGYKIIAGVDEAGRGPLAGPVVSAAVILPQNFSCKGINDSKKLSEKKRNAFFPVIKEQAICVATGLSSHHEIDQINILQASLLSMKRAVENLSGSPDFLLIDGKFTLNMDIDQAAVIKGDSRSISIAAASIIAKVTRDAIMKELHEKHPQYNFIQHKGYPTKAHKEAILKHGPCPVHRLTFKGVKEVINAG
ncbi:ribonuclease HII [Desulfobacula sp.]|uniref:ribonuclease HII n=1 Tax=Desulfobacula sp. TaxID=2593537 RepID=UPI0025BCEC1D|nr:ribonuclease HII [Desulfobacula sp.]MBC2703883.1 ribonuclease HII [Desulfobacula sp.]